MKYAALGILLLLIPACGGHHGAVHVKITNSGTTAAFADLVTKNGNTVLDRAAHATVAPGQSETFTLDAGDNGDLVVTVYRSTDNFKIFDDSWDQGDLDDHNGTIEITVAP